VSKLSNCQNCKIIYFEKGFDPGLDVLDGLTALRGEFPESHISLFRFLHQTRDVRSFLENNFKSLFCGLTCYGKQTREHRYRWVKNLGGLDVSSKFLGTVVL